MTADDKAAIGRMHGMLAHVKLLVKRELPPNMPVFQELFEQFEGAQNMAKKYGADQRAIDYANATLEQLVNAITSYRASQNLAAAAPSETRVEVEA